MAHDWNHDYNQAKAADKIEADARSGADQGTTANTQSSPPQK